MCTGRAELLSQKSIVGSIPGLVTGMIGDVRSSARPAVDTIFPSFIHFSDLLLTRN
jgi:hypothetical protein